MIILLACLLGLLVGVMLGCYGTLCHVIRKQKEFLSKPPQYIRGWDVGKGDDQMVRDSYIPPVNSMPPPK